MTKKLTKISKSLKSKRSKESDKLKKNSLKDDRILLKVALEILDSIREFFGPSAGYVSITELSTCPGPYPLSWSDFELYVRLRPNFTVILLGGKVYGYVFRALNWGNRVFIYSVFSFQPGSGDHLINLVRSSAMRTVLNEDATRVMKTSVKALQKSNPVFFNSTGAKWYSWQKSSGQKKGVF